MRVRFELLVGLLATVGPVTPAFGQNQHEKDDVHLRNDCRFASQVVSTGRPEPHYEWALRRLGACSATGPTVLADLWRVNDATSDLDILYWASRELRDRRLVEAVVGVLSDRNRSTLVRLNALRTVASFIDDKAFVESLDRFPELPPRFHSCVAGTDHPFSRLGDEPPAADAGERLLELLRQLSTTDPEPRVKSGAACLWRELRAWRTTSITDPQ